jgi:hypothetical protein
MSGENWTLPPGYRVTRDGRVFSTDSNWRGYGAREMAQHINKDGYAVVRLTVDGKRKKFRVHQLVCGAFHGPKPTPDHEVRHLDGDRTNNEARNLTWGTRSENALDRQRHGTQFNPPWHDPVFRASQVAALRAGWERKRANG